MKLWHLSPKSSVVESYDPEVNPWEPWFDKSFGFVIRAEDEAKARGIAAKNRAYEGESAWLEAKFSDCKELTADGEAGIIECNHMSA